MTTVTGFRDQGGDLGDRYLTKEDLIQIYRGLQPGAVTGGIVSSGTQANAQFGDKSTTNRISPVFAYGWGWITVSSCATHTAAIRADGTLWTWGSSYYGQLGLGISGLGAVRSSPSQIGSETGWWKVTTNTNSTWAIKRGGTLWYSGRNAYGEGGTNDTAMKTGFTQIGTDSSWRTVSAAEYYVLATKNDGTLWYWGRSQYGENGNSVSGLVQFSSPIQVGSSNQWRTIAVGGYSVGGIKNDGTLWMWGDNGGGQLGLNDRTSRSSPTQVTGSTWKSLSAGYVHTSAIKNDGTLWSWGGGYHDVSGFTYKSSPVQVGSASDWLRLPSKENGDTFYGYHSMAVIKKNGTLWVWGANSNGQLGLGDTSDRLVPTQRGVEQFYIECDCGGVGATQTVALTDIATQFNW